MMSKRKWQGEVARQKKRKGMTNQDVANMTGYSRKYIDNLTGNTFDSITARRKINAVLGITDTEDKSDLSSTV